MPESDKEQFRESYDEGDIEALISNPRFLVAVDAYGLNCCKMVHILRMAFDEPPYLPRGLGAEATADLILEIVRRIHIGRIHVDNAAKEKYSDLYRNRLGEPPTT